MNCPNCGAPMELFERRRYFSCRYCGSFHFLDAPEIDGLQVLERPGAPQQCAICGGALARALLDRTYPVAYCDRCRGVLMPRVSFAEVVGRRRAWASGAPLAALPPDRTELERRITCPSCRSRMDVHPYFGPGNVVIDACSACDLVWLDCGELKQIVDAPGRDRGAGISAPRQPDSPTGKHARGRGGDDLLDLLDNLLS